MEYLAKEGQSIDALKENEKDRAIRRGQCLKKRAIWGDLETLNNFLNFNISTI